MRRRARRPRRRALGAASRRRPCGSRQNGASTAPSTRERGQQGGCATAFSDLGMCRTGRGHRVARSPPLRSYRGALRRTATSAHTSALRPPSGSARQPASLVAGAGCRLLSACLGAARAAPRARAAASGRRRSAGRRRAARAAGASSSARSGPSPRSEAARCRGAAAAFRSARR